MADCCVFLCENGGVLFKDEHCIAENPMPRALAEEIAHDLWDRSDGQGEVMLSGQNCAYLMERGLGMLDRIQFIGNRYKVISDPSEIPEEIVKVSVYLHEGVEKYADRFVPRWQQANCAVAGPYWIDTTTANKGVGVESLCRVLGFAHDEVMAFGDNYNDVAMLDLVGTPYIMDGAAAPLRARYPLHTPRPEDVLRNFSGNDDSTHLWMNRTHPTENFLFKISQRFSLFWAFSVDVGGRVCYYNNSLMIALRPTAPHLWEEKAMKEFTYTIKEPVGIHARPAGMLAKEAKTCQSTVTIVDKNGKSVDATRLMALMGMGIKCGDTVTVKIEGADEDTAAPALEKFFNEHL